MMKTKIPASFEELIGNHYGSSDQCDTSNAAKAEELFANYYGKPLVPKGKKTPSAVVMSLSCDNGETLPQRKRHRRSEEYVVSQSEETAVPEEYVVAKGAPPRENFPDARGDAPVPEQNGARRETQVDVLQPLKEAPAPQAKTGETPPPFDWNSVSERKDDSPKQEQPASDNQPSRSPHEPSTVQSTEDDFVADMQAILTGQKVFDPMSKKMVAKDQLGREQSLPRQSEPSPQPLPQADNGQAIFDRIAQSMTYANAYDLGTVELETRFNDFDKNLEKRQAEAKKKPSTPAPVVGQSQSHSATDSTDFIHDLDAIRRQQFAASAPASPVVSSAATVQEYSRPFYDTGEHVLMGGDQYVDQLRVGRNPGVPYSYGQIIAMGDLYESVNQMMGTDVAELERVKKLIESSTRYYKSNKANKADDVGDDAWDKATNGRYLPLAVDNYEHFSPNLMLLGKAGLSSAYQNRDYKAAWEGHHQVALEEAAQLFLEHPNQSVFPESALIINAFGDHFLTDAFSAGHQINKAEVIQIFRANFYKPGTDELNTDGEAFFKRLADRAWRGRVKAEFSKLELSDFYWYKGFIPAGHPSINSASRFADVLTNIAEQAPDEAIGLSVKSLHDWLNDNGIEVTNSAGDGTWRLTGDGTLEAKNLAIIRKAVQQSINNVNEIMQGLYMSSPENTSSPPRTDPIIAFDILLPRVWQYVPQLTPASRTLMQKLIRDYTDPKSNTLINAAADLLERKVDLLVKKLVERKALRREVKMPDSISSMRRFTRR